MTADKLLVKRKDLLRSCFAPTDAPTDIFANSGCSLSIFILTYLVVYVQYFVNHMEVMVWENTKPSFQFYLINASITSRFRPCEDFAGI
ncbi:MAG: hypothetical protein EAZ59_15615 [Oscillatoriales cyanobacterium]|nr:MAG: hypothetical protein EAZ59_15615 [Oscillatoriales cyanobacterium]